jgi:hypothetical protein
VESRTWRGWEIVPPHRALPAVALVAALAFLHSLWTRGTRGGLWFAAVGLSAAALGEWFAVHAVRRVRHLAEPSISGIPPATVLGWYAITYASFSAAEALAAGPEGPEGIDGSHQPSRL